MLKHFTNKVWMITYERGMPNYSRTYGVVAMFNLPKKAQTVFEKILKEQSREDRQRCTYELKEVDMDKQTNLFNFFY